MKIIDLLNKIANGEEVPKLIHIMQFKNDFIFNGNDYISIDRLQQSIYSALHNEALNYEVEIIEYKEEKEEKKIPEKIDMFDYFTGYDFNGTDKDLLKHLEINFETINKSINEIIDYLKSKGE